MEIIVSVFILVLSCIKKHSKIVFILSLTVVFILFGWSHDLADEANYMVRYYYYNLSIYKNITAVLYTSLKAGANQLGLSYETWLILNALIYTIVTGFISAKYSGGNAAFPIAMLIIFPLCMDATQQRQTLGMCLGWIALHCFCCCNEGKRRIIPAFVMIILATLIHEVCAFYAVYCLAFIIKDTKKLTFVVLTGCLFLFVFGTGLVTLIGQKYFPTKIQSVLEGSSSRFSMYTHYTMWLKMASVFLIYFIPYLYIKYCTEDGENEFQNFMLRANLVALLGCPLILFSDDFYRVQQILILFDYCAIAQSFNNYGRH